MEGYNFDFGDYGPDTFHAEDNPQVEQAELFDDTAHHMGDDVDMIDDFGPELDVEQLRAEAQHLNNNSHRNTNEDAADKSSDSAPQPLRCVSANVQKSNENTHMLLETNKDADIICVQEIFWGHIKNVASSKKDDGDAYYNTVGHKDFMCLGARKDSRVAVYINRRWAKASPQVRENVIKHDDVLVITMHLPTGQFTFINAYNDSNTREAVNAMLDEAGRFPPICFMAGDFNVRHPFWDQAERARNSKTRSEHLNAGDDIIELAMTQLNLGMLNDEYGKPTWRSNNAQVREGVLDLVWVDNKALHRLQNL